MTRQKVIEDIGVDMNLIQGGDNWKQQLALYITGGNVPDLVAFMDANTFQGYAAEGAFYDLTDLIGNYPHIMEYLSTVNGYTAEDMLKRTSIDGRIYGIPSVTIARSYYTENIRTDWLEKLGLEMPVTLDDWTNVMRAFTNDDPDGDQQKHLRLQRQPYLQLSDPLLRRFRRASRPVLLPGRRWQGHHQCAERGLQGRADLPARHLRRGSDRPRNVHRQ